RRTTEISIPTGPGVEPRLRMIYSSDPIGVLDACVLYPAPVRDLLLSFANEGLFKPKWSEEIQREWSENLLANRTDLKKTQIQETIHAMNNAFPDANVEKYENFIQEIKIPDPNDRHVVAAALRSRADVIVTNNLKDFPPSITEKFGIEIQHPDLFLSNVYDLDPAKANAAFRKQLDRLKNPPIPESELFAILKELGLSKVVKRLMN
nr:PIN domain-containing protein [Saprospiraceae bacterium]